MRVTLEWELKFPPVIIPPSLHLYMICGKYFIKRQVNLTETLPTWRRKTEGFDCDFPFRLYFRALLKFLAFVSVFLIRFFFSRLVVLRRYTLRMYNFFCILIKECRFRFFVSCDTQHKLIARLI